MTKTKPKTKAKKASKPSVKPKAPKTAKKPAAKPTAPKKAEKLSSKTMAIYAALKQKDGATVEELAKLTGWQNHSVRGFISTVRSKNEIYTIDKFTRSDSGKTAYKLGEKEGSSKE
jgi:cell division septation protein DedD